MQELFSTIYVGKPKTLDEQIACARRELAMRKNVYPGWIAKGRMTQRNAQHEIECMEAIINTLEDVKEFKGKEQTADDGQVEF